MLDWMTDSLANAIDVVDVADVLTDSQRRQAARLLADGATAAAAAAAPGVAVDLVEEVARDG